ncbi:50S ribosomal L19- chloroplastic [Chlorella sorokiniana]|uniref:50S ribosomal L19-chloroplastic n=1 Tax=Chlorella sorokiniana TaxID=3076 RepID=A0A2P6TPU6_CHLSO|nr:50S ribosomal L19- chloroplastic [Chlorella sorokiniana]|eukprot:PRW56055.1 50S ribosomal L19- chloroplastic [Chlorella sorokiniana]
MAAPAAQLEASTRTLSSLISLRGFTQQSWAAQAATPSAAAQAPAAAAAAAAASPPAPWTPTRELQKRKTLPKRMQHLLTTLELEREAEFSAALQRPDFGPGDVIELKLAVPENKRRVTVFKGICIAKRNRSVRSSFTLRNIFGGSGGIERTFPLYSPHITEMKVLESRRVRRAKLYYLRERTAKEYRT